MYLSIYLSLSLSIYIYIYIHLHMYWFEALRRSGLALRVRGAS